MARWSRANRGRRDEAEPAAGPDQATSPEGLEEAEGSAADQAQGSAAEQAEAAGTGPDTEATEAAEPASTDSLQELTEMAESLLAQATDIRRQTQALADELAGREGWDAEPAPGPTTETFDAVQPGDGTEASAEPEPEPDPAQGMRIVAVNMAAAGRSREEAAVYLRETFGQEPDAALLDEVFAADAG
jgi:hypothetical protein